MSARMTSAFRAVIKSSLAQVMNDVLLRNPFDPGDHYLKQLPFATLVPEEIQRCAHFHTVFSTAFEDAWERLALVAANEGLGYGVTGHTLRGAIREERLRRIQEVLAQLEHPEKGRKRIKPDWVAELAYIRAGEGEAIPVTVVCDVYVEDRRKGDRFAFELKTPLPNSDITKVSKEKILKLYCMEPLQVEGAYYALPYNPYGRREDYAWSFPGRWFDMRKDEAVLIGDEFWNKIGGLGTYQSFIEAVNEIGKEYRDRIYREFLQREPPTPSISSLL